MYVGIRNANFELFEGTIIKIQVSLYTKNRCAEFHHLQNWTFASKGFSYIVRRSA